jgi:hypothetical protein
MKLACFLADKKEEKKKFHKFIFGVNMCNELHKKYWTVSSSDGCKLKITNKSIVYPVSYLFARFP